MRLLRDRVLNFLKQTVSWIGVILLCVFVTLVVLSPVAVGAQIESISPFVRLLLVVGLNGGLLGAAYLRMRQPPAKPVTGLIVRSPGAITEVSVESVRERILKTLNNLPDITAAAADVLAVHGRADVLLRVSVKGDDVNVPEKQREIDRVLKQVVNKQLGLQFAGPAKIHIQFHDEKPVVEKSADVLPVPSVPVVDTEASVEPPPVTEERSADVDTVDKLQNDEAPEKADLAIEIEDDEEKTPEPASNDSSWSKFMHMLTPAGETDQAADNDVEAAEAQVDKTEPEVDNTPAASDENGPTQ